MDMTGYLQKEAKMKKLFLLLLVLAGFAVSLPSQGMIGAVKGTIKDGKTQAPLVDVKVVLTDPQSKAKHEIRTDQDGYLYKSGLFPGNYAISFEKEGYVPASSTLYIRPGETRDISMTLEPIEQTAKGAAGLFNTGLQQVTDEKYADAVNTFTQALAEDQANFLAYYYRGFCREKLGDIAAALPDYVKTVELKADFVLGLSSLAKAYARKGDFARAAGYYKKACDLGTTDTNTIYNYGVSLVNLQKTEEARAMFEKLLTLDPGNADGCYELGLIYLGLGNTARSKELLEKFIQLDPQNQNAATAQEILKSLK
jgi:tetratricopeptide (TPR) repeat protein